MNSTLPNCRIIFLGTPDFAVASLDALVQYGFNVVAVVTAPDKPSGRGMKLTQSAVKTYAVEKSIPVLQPEKLKDPQFLEQLRAYKADLQVVVAFRMLPELVWNMPALGTVNLHGSLLPQYRGAAPINWAIINGEKETGVTTFLLKHAIDTGDILIRKSMPIGPEDDFRDVHDRMKLIGAEVLVETVVGLCNHTIKGMPQDAITEATLKPAPKIFTDHCAINWNKTAIEVNNLIRGLSPVPGAFTTLHGKNLKIFKARIMHQWAGHGSMHTDGETPGSSCIAGTAPKMLLFRASDAWLEILELQLEGKKRMAAEDFLRGYHWPQT